MRTYHVWVRCILYMFHNNSRKEVLKVTSLHFFRWGNWGLESHPVSEWWTRHSDSSPIPFITTQWVYSFLKGQLCPHFELGLCWKVDIQRPPGLRGETDMCVCNPVHLRCIYHSAISNSRKANKLVNRISLQLHSAVMEPNTDLLWPFLFQAVLKFVWIERGVDGLSSTKRHLIPDF